MGRKRTPGLRKRGEYWHIDKTIYGTRLCESTRTNNLEEAERVLVNRIEEIRKATLFSVRKPRSFAEAATKYLMENQHKASIRDEADHLKLLHGYIGKLQLEQVHNGTLAPFIAARIKQGVKNKTVNLALGVVRRILNLAALEWLDEFGKSWLLSAPRIKLLPLTDAREPYPLSLSGTKPLIFFFASAFTQYGNVWLIRVVVNLKCVLCNGNGKLKYLNSKAVSLLFLNT